jgi:Zn-dependent peptidase ImmA (M78 family)/transcriptional regulator with XRE-family HTH domain
MLLTEARINNDMITLARESRGLTQKELASLLGLSQGKLCRVEQDDQSFSEEIVERLSDILKYPRSFFYREGESFIPSSIDFRRRVKVPNKLLKEINAKINLHRLIIEKLLSENANPSWPILKSRQNPLPVEAAIRLRKTWGMDKGPINNLTDWLEANGIIIIAFDFGTERVDSRVMIAKNNGVIIINSLMLGDRQRFSLAYELGHLVLHTDATTSLENRDIAHEANLFASEFLMPQEDIIDDLRGEITVSRLAELKRKWKVSMHALLYRAEDLNIISYNQKRYLLGQFNSMNIRRREPPEFDVPKERPALLGKLLTKYQRLNRLKDFEMAELFHHTQEEFTTKYLKVIN